MKLLSLTIVYTIVVVAIIVGGIMAANASWDCGDTPTVRLPSPAPAGEQLIYRPDGSAELCTTYGDGITYCR